VRTFLALGSNLGDRWRYLRDAVDALDALDHVVGKSAVYETEPQGGPSGQSSYLNCVVELDTTLTPRQLLQVCHRLEAAAQRVRAERWGPRTLDVDILLVGDLEVNEPDLQIPHPRMWERRFVLQPLADLAPTLVASALDQLCGGSVRRAGTL